MQISARGDYAVRACLALALAHPAKVSTQTLATEQHLPRKFLENILGDLRRAGVVHSVRGVDGGYTLARQPDDIQIGDVLRATDGPLAGVRGMRPEETVYEGSAVHLQELWIAVRASVRRVLDEVSLADVAKGRLPAHVRRLITDQEAWQPR
jgi:Rrf2 family protein